MNLRDVPNIWNQEIALDAEDLGTVADSNVVGGIPFVHIIPVPDAATGNVDTVITHKMLVLDVWVTKTGALGGAANTVELRNGTTNPITEAIDINVADKTVVHATTIDDARHELAAGATLRVVRTKAGGNAACRVHVLGVRVA